MTLQNTPKATSLVVSSGSNFGSTNLNNLTGIGVSLVIDGSQLTQSVQCRLNGDTGCTFTVHAGISFGFGFKDIQFTSVDFANNASGATNQTLQYVVGVVPTVQLGGYSH